MVFSASLTCEMLVADSFWDLESAFGCADGVMRTATGYCGGSLVKPRYKEVSLFLIPSDPNFEDKMIVI